jgi:hypothetical protein
MPGETGSGWRNGTGVDDRFNVGLGDSMLARASVLGVQTRQVGVGESQDVVDVDSQESAGDQCGTDATKGRAQQIGPGLLGGVDLVAFSDQVGR